MKARWMEYVECLGCVEWFCCVFIDSMKSSYLVIQLHFMDMHVPVCLFVCIVFAVLEPDKHSFPLELMQLLTG